MPLCLKSVLVASSCITTKGGGGADILHQADLEDNIYISLS